MVDDLVVFVEFELQNTSLFLFLRNKLTSKCSNETFSIGDVFSWEAVNSEIKCSQVLHNGIITEDTDISFRSQT